LLDPTDKQEFVTLRIFPARTVYRVTLPIMPAFTVQVAAAPPPPAAPSCLRLGQQAGPPKTTCRSRAT